MPPSATASDRPTVETACADRVGSLRPTHVDSSLAALLGGARRRHRLRRLGVALSSACWSAACALLTSAAVHLPASIAVVGAVLVGLVTLLRRRASDFELLAAIDRRLGLRELLVSAATISGDREGVRLVRDQAARVAETIDVRAVFADPNAPRRLTTAGVALATSVAITFALPRRVAETRVAAGAGGTSVAAPKADDVRARVSFLSPRRDLSNVSPDASASAAQATSGDTPSPGTHDGVGKSAGTTAAVPMPFARVVDNVAAEGEGSRGLATVARPSQGRARGRLDNVAASDATLDTPRDDLISSPSAAASGVRPAVGADRVPAASRDLVRAFFTPEAKP